MAEKLDISRQTLSNWENGKTLPNISNILMMSDLYKISLDELLKGDIKMKKKIVDDQKFFDSMKKASIYIFALLFIIAVVNFLALFVKGNFKDFVDGATPWVILSVVIAGAAALMAAKETSLKIVEEDNQENE